MWRFERCGKLANYVIFVLGSRQVFDRSGADMWEVAKFLLGWLGVSLVATPFIAAALKRRVG